MSIRNEVNHRCAEGGLIRLSGLVRGATERRAVYVVPGIRDFVINGPATNANGEEERWARVAEALAWFIEGRLILVPEENTYDTEAFMLRLRPPPPEIWEIRVRAPEPGIRLLGRFADKDAFVVLTWHYREELGFPTTPEGAAAWHNAMSRCHTHWRNLFQPWASHSGVNYPDDYLSNAECI